MGLPVTVYRWDDAGAPQLDGTISGMIDTIRKCLVDGYGAKSGLGWAVEMEDAPNFKIVFRNSTADASGGYVQMNANTGLDNSPYLYWRGARGVPSFDSFIKPTRRKAIPNVAYQDKWVLIGTSAAFYLMIGINSYTTCYTTTASGVGVWFCGDFDSNVTNDAGRFILCGGIGDSDQTSAGWNSSLSYPEKDKTIDQIYDTDGADYTHAYKTTSQDVLTIYGGYATTLGGVISYLDFSIYADTPLAYDRDGEYMMNSNTRPYFRGKLPGMLISGNGGEGGETFPYTKQIDGIDHMMTIGYAPQLFINTVTWYD